MHAICFEDCSRVDVLSAKQSHEQRTIWQSHLIVIFPPEPTTPTIQLLGVKGEATASVSHLKPIQNPLYSTMQSLGVESEDSGYNDFN